RADIFEQANFVFLQHTGEFRQITGGMSDGVNSGHAAQWMLEDDKGQSRMTMNRMLSDVTATDCLAHSAAARLHLQTPSSDQSERGLPPLAPQRAGFPGAGVQPIGLR